MTPAKESMPSAKGRKQHGQPALGYGKSSRRQLMERFGWSSTFLWSLMRRHGLPYRKLGKWLVFIDAEVEAWADQLPGQRLGKR